MFCIGMPENGNPWSQLVLRVAHPQKKRNFWVPKKRNFWVPIFGGGRIVPPIDVGCSHNIESSHY